MKHFLGDWRAGKNAVKLDDTDPFVHACASMAFGFSPVPNKERGFKHINRAVSLNPHDWELMFLRAWQLSFMGSPQEALDILDKIRALNPLGGYMVSECLADTYYMMSWYSSTEIQRKRCPYLLPVTPSLAVWMRLKRALPNSSTLSRKDLNWWPLPRRKL